MKLTQDQIRQFAYQMRILFTPDDLENVTDKINTELEAFQEIQKIGTEGVEPLFFVNDRQNVFREDVVQPSLSREESLKNSPKHDGECFLFPAVLG